MKEQNFHIASYANDTNLLLTGENYPEITNFDSELMVKAKKWFSRNGHGKGKHNNIRTSQQQIQIPTINDKYNK